MKLAFSFYSVASIILVCFSKRSFPTQKTKKEGWDEILGSWKLRSTLQVINIYWKVAKSTFQGKNKCNPLIAPAAGAANSGGIRWIQIWLIGIKKAQVLDQSKICRELVANQCFEFFVHNTKSVENQLEKNILPKKRKHANLNLLLSIFNFTRTVVMCVFVHTQVNSRKACVVGVLLEMRAVAYTRLLLRMQVYP